MFMLSSESEDKVAAGVMFFISVIGLFANFAVTVFTHTLSTMNNSFGRLIASQACVEFLICAIFTFYVTPMLFFDIQPMKENARIPGWLGFLCYDICIWSHLFISMNRLAAICFPLKYQKIFSDRITLLLAVFAWLIPIGTTIFMFILFRKFDCDFYFSEKYWAFIFTQSEVCAFISWNVDFCKDIVILIVIGTADSITIIQVRRTRKLAASSSRTQRERRKVEINFFRQAVLQSLIFVIELLTYFIFAWKFENRFIIWSLTTVAWLLVHSVDGIITIMFNREFRVFVFSKLCKTLSQTVFRTDSTTVS